MQKYVNGNLVDMTPDEVAAIETEQAEREANSLQKRRASASLPRAQFALAAAMAGYITEDEAEDWAAGVAPPAWVADALDGAIAAGAIPEGQRLAIRIAARTQVSIHRTDKLIPVLAAAKAMSDEAVDALFGIDNAASAA